ncbi:hypothetical protein NN561_012073 [Cricetulus griseus]
MSMQPRNFRPKVTTEPEMPVSTRLTVHRPEAAQNRVRRSMPARHSKHIRNSAPVHQASDSSSDDGIEEAIQLYQLKKTRNEASGEPPLRAQLKEESPGSAQPSALPEAHRRLPSKEKLAAPKVVDTTLGSLHPDPLSKLLKDVRTSVLPGHTAAKSKAVHLATSYLADTSTELICSEAIPDISNTILPVPMEGSDRPQTMNPLFCLPPIPPHSEGDSSNIDSDDSIEQGIRTILALKAQGGLGKVSEGKCAGEKESSEDKSSSLDSDEDLDMAIKDLLRSKRRFKKRCRESRAVCKKVRFGTTETQCGEKLSSLPGDWEDHGQQALQSCLFKCRGDNKDIPGRSPVSIFSSAAKRAKLGGTGGEDTSPDLFPRKKSPEGTPPAKDTGVSGCPSSASSPLSEDSSVDCDDSIELEIRKFLAEKAKESVRSSEHQGGPAKPEMPCRKEPTLGLQPGVCTQSPKARETP